MSEKYSRYYKKFIIGSAAIAFSSVITIVSFASMGSLINLTDPMNNFEAFPVKYDALVQLNGRYVKFDELPVIRDGRILVPIRGLFEAFNAEVSWDDENKVAIINAKEFSIHLPVGSKKAIVNLADVPLDAATTIINGRVYVPMRFIAETLGAEVSWNDATKIANIKGAGVKQEEYDAFKIKGDDIFVKNTINALNLIKDKLTPEDYNFLKTNIGSFLQESADGVNPKIKPALLYVKNSTSDASTAWYIGSIYYNASMSKFYADAANGTANVVDSAWKTDKNRWDSLEKQIEVIKKAGGSTKEIDYAESLRGVKWWEPK